MARRPRESSAKGHTTPPLMVRVEDPISDHPGIGPLRDARMKKIAKSVRGGKAKVKVKVDVEAGHG